MSQCLLKDTIFFEIIHDWLCLLSYLMSKWVCTNFFSHTIYKYTLYIFFRGCCASSSPLYFCELVEQLNFTVA